MNILDYCAYSRKIRISTWLCGLALLYVQVAYAQLTPFDPKKRSELEAKLSQVEIKVERTTVLLDLHDQWMYVDPNRAYGYNDQALELAKTLRNPVLLARAYGNKGNKGFDAGNLDLALKDYIKSCSFISIENQPLINALNFSNISNVFALKGDYSTAMEYSYRSIKLCEKVPSGLNLRCHTRANLTEMYINLQQFEKAEFLLKLNLKELRSIRSPTVNAMTFNNLGVVYRNKKLYGKAIDHFQQALRYSEPYDLNYFTSSICAQISEVYLTEKQPLKALPFARRARYLSIRHGDAQVETISSRDMAQIFLALNRLDSAYFYAQYALNLSSYKGIQSLRPSTLLTYAQVLKQQKQYDASLKAMQAAQTLSDSIFSEKTKAQSANRLEAFSTLETQQNVRQRYANEIHQARLIRSITTFAIGLALLIGLGIYVLYRQRQEANKVLTNKGADIEAQRKELLNLNQVKDQLFSAIASELRAPLNAIQGVLANLEKGVAQQEIILGQLRQQTMRTIALLEDLLFTARVQMQQYQPLRQEFQLKKLVEDLDKNMRAMNNGAYTPIVYQIPPDLDMYSDPTMLKMVIRNLLLLVAHRPGKRGVPMALNAWREADRVNIRIGDVAESPAEIDSLSKTDSLPYKPYWDLDLIRSFIKSYGGILIECSEGKGYDLVLPDAQGA